MNHSRALWRRRALGLGATALGYYLLFWVVLAKVNVGWLPKTDTMATTVIAYWRDLPFFTVEKGPDADGHGQVTYYTVPTRQVTRQELAQMMGTNAAPNPAPPPGAGTPAKNGTGPR